MPPPPSTVNCAVDCVVDCAVTLYGSLLSFKRQQKRRDAKGPNHKMAGFSSKVMLGDLDDFISPTQSCTNPLFVSQGDESASGAKDVGVAKLSLASDDLFVSSEIVQPNLIGSSEKRTATVSLNDCLACSGCVTSAETVLISQQSGSEFLNALKKEYSLFVLTVSPQARASLAAEFNVTSLEMHSILESYFQVTTHISCIVINTEQGVNSPWVLTLSWILAAQRISPYLR